MSIRTRFFIYFISLIGLSILLSQLLLSTHTQPMLAFWIKILVLISCFVILFLLVKRDFLSPMLDLQRWLKHYKTNQTHLNYQKNTSLQDIPNFVTHLVNENKGLYDEMDAVLQTQIKRLSKKSSLLETLYSVSSSLNEITDTNQLLNYFLSLFVNMTQANSGVIRLLDKNTHLNLASAKGNIETNEQVNHINKKDCICVDIASDAQESVQFSVHNCAKCIGKVSAKQCQYGTIFIPLIYKGSTMGIVSLFFDKPPSLSEDERALLKAVGGHLALALDKTNGEAQARAMRLSQERLYLSQDIHDSLSQILYSVGLQTSALLDIIQKSSKLEASNKAQEIQDSISQANNELRRLLHNVRKPIENEDILTKIKAIARKIEQETQLNIYVQCINIMQASPEVEQQVLGITQEALTNIKKHAHAHNVRILLSPSSLMIEDDGCGFNVTNNKSHNGFHLGLSILQERAQRINAELNIDSEPEEGTQITLILNKDLK